MRLPRLSWYSCVNFLIRSSDSSATHVIQCHCFSKYKEISYDALVEFTSCTTYRKEFDTADGCM